jgi:hypothetical protein
LDAALSDAEGRGDDYLVATCAAGHSSLAWLVSGRIDETRRWAERVLELAPPGFSSQPYLHLVTVTAADLYEARGSEASTRVERSWQAIRDNHFLGLSNIGDDLRQTRARSAIAAAAKAANGAGSSKRVTSLTLLASKEADRVARSDLPFAEGWAELLRAGVLAVHGDRHRAARAVERGMAAMDACRMSFYAAAARYALGTLQPSASKVRLDGEKWMIENGVVDCHSAARMLIPGCVV